MTVTRLPRPTASYTVDFRRKATKAQGKGRVQRVARLLALAHRIDGLIRAGEIRDLADAARLAGLTRARVTQISNLLLLAPSIQEAVLNLPRVHRGRDPIRERALRTVAAEPQWNDQLRMWNALRRRATETERE